MVLPTTPISVTLLGGDRTVYEAGLDGIGSDPTSNSELTSGQFQIARTGTTTFSSLTIDGKTISLSSPAGTRIEGEYGTLTITGYDRRTNIFTYEYELKEAADHQAGTVRIFDDFNIVLKSQRGQTVTTKLDIEVINDLPVARDDEDRLGEYADAKSGNVITGENVVITGLEGADTLGADRPTNVVGVEAGAQTHHVDGGVDTAIEGLYGYLVLGAEGGYTYTPKADAPDDVEDVFTYTIQDHDGDRSTATLTVEVVRDTVPVVFITPVTVDEDGLPNHAVDDGRPGEVDYGNSAVAEQVITVDFGKDVPANLAEAVTFDITGWDPGLKSGGEPVEWTTEDGGRTLVGTAAGEAVIKIEIGTATADASGKYNYPYTVTLLKAVDHENPTLEDTFVIKDIPVLVADSDHNVTGSKGTVVSYFDVTVGDDKPYAYDDVATVSDSATEPVTGNVIKGDGTSEPDSVGADGGRVTSIAYEDAQGNPATADVPADGFVEIVTQNGTVKFYSNGDYEYQRTTDDAAEDVFTYTLTDNDGDSVTANLTVVVEADGRPEFLTIVPVLADEDGLPNHVVDDGRPGEFDYLQNASPQGTITVAFGNDIPAEPIQALAFTPAQDWDPGLKSGGETVVWTTENNGRTLVGKVGDTTVIDIAITAVNPVLGGDPGTFTYNYTLTLHQNIDHLDPTEEDIFELANIPLTATDSDGSTTETIFAVEIGDDQPFVDVAGETSANESTSVEGTWQVGAGADGVVPEKLTVTIDGGNPQEITIGEPINVPGKGTLTFEVAPDGSGTWTFEAGSVSSDTTVSFVIDAEDGDGDTATDSHTIAIRDVSKYLIVGSPVDDISASTTPHTVRRADGVTETPHTGQIVGGREADVLIGDLGGVNPSNAGQTLNLVLVLDLSGSMDTSTISWTNTDGTTQNITRTEALKRAATQLVEKLSDPTTGASDIKLHLIKFGTSADQGQTFDILNTDGKDDALSWINGLTTDGYTNYEAGLYRAGEWIKGDIASDQPIANADKNTVLFISDGAPNYAWTGNTVGNAGSFNANSAIQHVLGTYAPASGTPDNESEIDGIATEVFGNEFTLSSIGIAVSDLQYLNQVTANGGEVLNIRKGQELENVIGDLSGANPFKSVGSDTFDGGAGDDIIFGDVLFTDVLRDKAGLSEALFPDGSGWDVFTALESNSYDLGSSAVASYLEGGQWTATSTENYIRDNHVELSAESISPNGIGRPGGNDVINGGDGNDIIYGQEGNDVINGGAGNDTINGGTGRDTLTGGAGDDTFVFAKGDGNTSDAIDTITDFGNGVDVIKTGTAGDGDNYTEIDGSADYAAALAAADSAFGGDAGLKYVLAGVGADSYLFINWEGEPGADHAIKLTGVTTADFQADYIVA